MSVIWFKPKVVYVEHAVALKHWARRPVEEGAPDTKYWATCPYCSGHSQVSYNYMRKYGEFDCKHCHCRCVGPTLIPDPGTIFGFGRCYWTRIILN